jgi:hypothetical protein
MAYAFNPTPFTFSLIPLSAFISRLRFLHLPLPPNYLKFMLQLQVLRQDTAAVKARLGRKHFTDLQLVDAIIALDVERKITTIFR